MMIMRRRLSVLKSAAKLCLMLGIFLLVWCASFAWLIVVCVLNPTDRLSGNPSLNERILIAPGSFLLREFDRWKSAPAVSLSDEFRDARPHVEARN